MWIFLNDAFLSIVAHRAKPDALLVRARARGDLERTFPGVKVSRTPDADYLYRAEVPISRVAGEIGQRIREIDYPNFKNSVAEHDRHDAYAGVWNVMYGFQCERKRAEQAGADLPDLRTGTQLFTRTGKDVVIEMVQPLFSGGAAVSMVYRKSGKRYTFPMKAAQQRLRGAHEYPF